MKRKGEEGGEREKWKWGFRGGEEERHGDGGGLWGRRILRGGVVKDKEC